MGLDAARLVGCASRLRAALARMLAAMALSGVLSAAALAQDWWTETGIAVDVTAENAVAARQKGIESGQREGLRRLFERLVPAEQRARLPAPEGLPIARFVRSFEIAEEKMARDRWVATLNVTFDPDAVRELLAGRGVAMLEPTAAPVLLVIPVERQAGELRSWAREDPWWQAWERLADTERVLRLVLPLGDLIDLATLPPEAIERAERAALERLAQRYGAADAVVALLEPAGSAVAGEGPVVVRLSAAGLLLDEGPAPLTVAAGPGEPHEAAARAALARLEESWRRTALVRSDQLVELTVSVPLADLSSWVQIRRELETLPEIRELRIARIGRERAELVVSYPGDLDRLRAGLARRGLELALEDGGWQLRAAGVRPAVAPR